MNDRCEIRLILYNADDIININIIINIKVKIWFTQWFTIWGMFIYIYIFFFMISRLSVSVYALGNISLCLRSFGEFITRVSIHHLVSSATS